MGVGQSGPSPVSMSDATLLVSVKFIKPERGVK
jgi:hypothetical protein